jgi:hypothetical protein
MKTARSATKTLGAACLVTIAVACSGPAEAGWYDYLFGRYSGYNTFTQFNILTPGAGGIYAAVAPGYIYTHNLDIYGNPLTSNGQRADIYNLGYMNYLSTTPLYNSSAGYPNIWSNLSGLLSIGGF